MALKDVIRGLDDFVFVCVAIVITIVILIVVGSTAYYQCTEGLDNQVSMQECRLLCGDGHIESWSVHECKCK